MLSIGADPALARRAQRPWCGWWRRPSCRSFAPSPAHCRHRSGGRMCRGAFTSTMSEICATSISAATRGQHILAHGGRRREQHVVILHQRQDEVGGLLRQPAAEMRRLGQEDFTHALQLARRLGNAAAALARDQKIHLAAEFARGGERLRGRRRERLVVVFGKKQDRHVTAPLPRSSACRPAPPRCRP